MKSQPMKGTNLSMHSLGSESVCNLWSRLGLPNTGEFIPLIHQTQSVLQTLHHSLSTPATQCPLCSERPKTDRRIQDEALPVPSSGGDHFPSPADHTWWYKPGYHWPSWLPGHTDGSHSATVNQHPQVLSHWAAFQALCPKPVELHGAVVTQMRDPSFGFVDSHRIGLSPSIQHVQISRQNLPALQQISTHAQLGVSKLTEGAFKPIVQMTDKDKQNWPQY
ncbi:hypothetical protein BTVI_52727 [Pitangus sulphuratus]|nr:hypothetical protein BTVI_52727 [Pitangus sulphuratus]